MPPVAAIARSSSSVRYRGKSCSVRAPVCDDTIGAVVLAAAASTVARSPWATSTTTPSRFIRATTRCPSGVSPGWVRRRTGSGPAYRCHGRQVVPRVLSPRCTNPISRTPRWCHASTRSTSSIQGVGALDAEQDSGPTSSPGQQQSLDRGDDDGTGFAGLPLDPIQLGGDRSPGAPSEVAARDDRVAHRRRDGGVHSALLQHVEGVLGRRSHRRVPHRAERLGHEPRTVGVQVDHEHLAVQLFAVVGHVSSLRPSTRVLRHRIRRCAR